MGYAPRCSHQILISFETIPLQMCGNMCVVCEILRGSTAYACLR